MYLFIKISSITDKVKLKPGDNILYLPDWKNKQIKKSGKAFDQNMNNWKSQELFLKV